METGTRNCFVTIQSNAPTRSASGQAVDVWSTYKSLWGEINQVRGGETWRSRQVHAEADHALTFDWIDAPAVTPRMRVVYGSRVFDVLAVNNLGERNQRVVVDMRERGL